MPSQQWQPLLAAATFALLWMTHPAQAKCLSPSAESGATATTVYRCPEQDPATAKQPIIVNPEKTTVVERGSSDEPWFEPKPLKTKAKPALAPANKPAEAVKPIDADNPVIKSVDADKPVIKPTKAKKKTVAKTKLASKRQLKVKATKVSTAKPKTVKKAPAPKIVSAKSDDDKVIVWTKKDMPLGSRIVNWLGF